MSADLPPLPEWSKRDDLGGLVPSEIRSEFRVYALAARAPLEGENERLRAALQGIVTSLSDADEEGLIEHAEQMIAARAALEPKP